MALRPISPTMIRKIATMKLSSRGTIRINPEDVSGAVAEIERARAIALAERGPLAPDRLDLLLPDGERQGVDARVRAEAASVGDRHQAGGMLRLGRPGEPAEQPTPDPQSSETAEPGEGDGASGEVAACTADQVEVTPVTDAASYTADQQPLLSLTLLNTGADPCTIEAGSDVQSYVITSGSDRIWASTDCQEPGVPAVVTLEPGDKLQINLNTNVPETAAVQKTMAGMIEQDGASLVMDLRTRPQHAWPTTPVTRPRSCSTCPSRTRTIRSRRPRSTTTATTRPTCPSQTPSTRTTRARPSTSGGSSPAAGPCACDRVIAGPRVEDHDLVGERDRRQPVSDDQRRPPFHRLAQPQDQIVERR